jgi:uncharacterized protein YggT (Ycf19 family)
MLNPVRFIIYLIFYAIELLLVVRLILKFFAANLSAPFVAWIYRASEPLLAPFRNIFPTIKMGNFTLEFTTLFALIIYVLIGYLFMELVYFLMRNLDERRP